MENDYGFTWLDALCLFGTPLGWPNFAYNFALPRPSRWLQRTLDPIRCTLCVKPGGSRVLTSGQNQLFPSRGYTAETYAKVMGGSPPSQPRIKPKCTLFVC